MQMQATDYSPTSINSNVPTTDVYIWRPVGALISTVLSQMILGSRVYAASHV